MKRLQFLEGLNHIRLGSECFGLGYELLFFSEIFLEVVVA